MVLHGVLCGSSLVNSFPKRHLKVKFKLVIFSDDLVS